MADFEQGIEQSWREFRAALGDALAGLDQGGRVHFDVDSETEVEGVPPFVGIHIVDGQLLVAMAGNEWLSEGQRLRKPARRRIRELGFHKPDEQMPNYWMSIAQRQADRAAFVVVTALREAYGVTHPAFLIGDLEGFRDSVSARPSSSAADDGPLAVTPEGRVELDTLIDAALEPVLGHTPFRDDDGDIGIRLGTAFMFVRTRDDEPLAEFIAQVVTEVGDYGEALEAVNELNQQLEGVRFVASGGCIYAHQEIVVSPFVPDAFRATLARFCLVVSANDEELAARVGGQVFLPDRDDDAAGEEEVHPVMLQLLQLDAEEPGSLKPKDVARICGHDSDLITELITWNEEQEIAWRHARDEALNDAAERDVCEHERAHAEYTVKLLRKTLRRVLLG